MGRQREENQQQPFIPIRAVTINSHFRGQSPSTKKAGSPTLDPPFSKKLLLKRPYTLLFKMLLTHLAVHPVTHSEIFSPVPTPLLSSHQKLIHDESNSLCASHCLHCSQQDHNPPLPCYYRHAFRIWCILIQYHAISNCLPFQSYGTQTRSF